ncbi:MAG TPA: cyclic nucleotide-binding domain-containing protein [Polyangia bacterium]
MKVADLQGLLPGYSIGEIEQILVATRPRRFRAGGWLYREGDAATCCFFLVKGVVEVVKFLDGEEQILTTLRPGHLVGQPGLVAGAIRSASVRAKTACSVLEIKRRGFQRALQARHAFALRFQEQIAVAGIRQLRAATDQLAMVLSRSLSPAGQPAAPLDRQALTFIQACTGEWDVSITAGARQLGVAKRRLA